MSSFAGIVLMFLTGICKASNQRFTRKQLSKVSGFQQEFLENSLLTLPPPISSKSRLASSARSAEALSQMCFAVWLLRMFEYIRPACKDTIAGWKTLMHPLTILKRGSLVRSAGLCPCQRLDQVTTACQIDEEMTAEMRSARTIPE